MSAVIAWVMFLFFGLGMLEPTDPQWAPPPVGSQGIQPSCVGWALAGWLESGPGARPRWATPDPMWIYLTAHAHDGLPLPHAGTTLPAAWDVLIAAGVVAPGSVRRTQDRLTAGLWLTRAPVVLETSWEPSMDSPAADGTVTVVLSPEHGRHAVVCYGTDGRGAALDCVNSWGPDWGQHGQFRIKADDLDVLLKDGGIIWQADKLPVGANRAN